jgi:RNA polymerase sigma-70 factor (ECF subfamily)
MTETLTFSNLDDSTLIRLALDDVLQEVQLKVWRGLSSFRADSTFRTWMTRVAINEALQLRRREKFGLYLALDDFPTLASGIESPHSCLSRAEQSQALRRAVVELPKTYRLDSRAGASRLVLVCQTAN